MSFPKNHPRYGGRQKGTLNKATHEKALETFERMKFDPLERLIRLVRKKETNPELKVRALGEMLKYRHPRLANMTVTADITSTVTTERITQLCMDPRTAEHLEALAFALAAPTPAAGRRSLPAVDENVIDVEPEPPVDPQSVNPLSL